MAFTIIIFLVITFFSLYLISGKQSFLSKKQEFSSTFKEGLAVLDEKSDYPISFPAQWNEEVEAWGFWCIVPNLELNSYTSSPIALPQGFYIHYTLNCQYLDFQQKIQTIELSVAEYMPDNERYKIESRTASGGIKNILPKQAILYSLNQEGLVGTGQVIRINFGIPEDIHQSMTRRGFAFESMRERYSYDQLKKFAETGDPSIVDNIIMALNVSFKNSVSDEQIAK